MTRHAGPQVAPQPVGQVAQVPAQVAAQVLAHVAAQVLPQVTFWVGQSQVRQVSARRQVWQVPRQVSQVRQVVPWVSRQVSGLHTVHPLGQSFAVGHPMSVGQPPQDGPGHSASQVSACCISGRACDVSGWTANGSPLTVAVRT